MTLGEKIKELRKKYGFTQEKLAEQLAVSRQAITKWETDGGIPDIENITAIAKLFHVSADYLLSDESSEEASSDYLYDSINTYDIDKPKHFDIHLGSGKKLIVTSCNEEKIKLRLASNTISTVAGDFKLKIDDNRSSIDLDILRKNGIGETKAKEELDIYLYLPKEQILSFEIAANIETIELRDLKCDNIELDVKTSRVVMNKVQSKAEINCNLDMTVICESLEASLDINQLSACSRLYLPDGTQFSVKHEGKNNTISFENGENFSAKNAEKVIELNGRKSELTICKLK